MNASTAAEISNGLTLVRGLGTAREIPLVPDYELLRRIGGGAYGDVWLARSKATGTLRAAKIVWRHRFEDDRPFQREFEGIQRFEKISRAHPSQLALFHVGRNEAEGCFYYIMELADGTNRLNPGGSANPISGDPASAVDSYVPDTLRARLANGRLPPAEVLEIGLVLTEALDHLHRQRLVHRDVKPSNVIFVNGRPKLADIGLVTDASDQCSIVGTEGYLPPEGPGTPQADIYSLGKVLYEITTAQDRRRFPDLPPEVKTWPDAEQVLELNQIILKACSTGTQQRYPGAQAMHDDLSRLAQGKSLRRARRVQRLWRLALRGGIGLAVTATAVGSIALARRAGKEPAPSYTGRLSTNGLANHWLKMGKAHYDTFQGTNFAAAAECFQQAIQADTNFALAYAYLANAYSWGGFGDWNGGWQFLPKAKAAAKQALKLDPRLSDPHQVLSEYHSLREWDWREAEREVELAGRLNPRSASWYLYKSELSRMMGKTEEALKEINEAKALDPHSGNINHRLIYYLVFARRFDEALEQVGLVAAMERRADLPWERKFIYMALGQATNAILAERDGRIADGEPNDKVDRETAEKLRTAATDGMKALWRPQLEYSSKQKNIYELAGCHAQLGEVDAAIHCLQQLLARDHDTMLTFNIMTDWALDPIRSDFRFHEILRSMGLE